MATLSATMILNRVVVSEVVADPNTVPRTVVAGSSSAITGAAGGQNKVDETALAGAFRQYGNGNTRLILGAATARAQPMSLIALSPAQVQTLRDLAGHTVCIRDTYGRKMFGAYLDVQVMAVPLSGSVQAGTLLQNVALTFTGVTHSEQV